MQRKRAGEVKAVCLCVCVFVWAEGEDEIMGFHCATGGRGRHEYTEKAQGKERWLDNKK